MTEQIDMRQLELRASPDESGACVIYVMSRDQRTRDNFALLAAQAEALKHELPLVVVFNLYTKLGFRRREHFQFMVDGLKEVELELSKKCIPFILTIGNMPTEIEKHTETLQPRSLYFDFSPLRASRRAQKELAGRLSCRVIVVDTHNIIPTWVTSDKEEYAAHTIRRKIHKLITDWATDPPALKKHPFKFSEAPRSRTWAEADKAIAGIPKNGITHNFKSGEKAAAKSLKEFIETGLDAYASGRNDATKDAQSNLSPYLHYGQLSSLRIVLDILDSSNHVPQIFHSFKMPSYDGQPTRADGIDAFVEELVVRRELSDNFCLHNPHYDSLDGATDWAKKTLASHADDPRETIYTKQQLNDALTHDELWNAAQIQLTTSGKIHGYMRMYWAKKILEWTPSADEAIKIAIELNDTYHLDGGDPNGYVGIMWSIAGIHDRPWFDRSIYGAIRYMSDGGIAKKFDTKKYITQWRSVA